MGDSIPHWAGVRAKYRSVEHLNLPGGVTIAWWGVRGMGWDDFIHQMQLPVLFRSPPKVIVLHLGGNDLVQHSLQVNFKLVQESIEYLTTAFPDLVLLWVNILQRSNWRAPELENKAIERKRKRVNQFGRKLMRCHNGHVLDVEIDTSTPGFYRNDGVHLSDVGLDLYLFSLKEKLCEIL